MEQREKLEKFEGERIEIIGTFERFGKKNGWCGREEKTVLLINVTDTNNNLLCDHIWFNCTKQFEKLDLKQNDKVKLQARVNEYVKGYFGRRLDIYKESGVDYKLSYPTKITKLE